MKRLMLVSCPTLLLTIPPKLISMAGDAEAGPGAGDAGSDRAAKRAADVAFDQAPGEEESKRPASAEHPTASAGDETGDESIEIKVQFGKAAQMVTRRLDSTVAQLKQEIEKHTGEGGRRRLALF